jgi:hypothetical protein
MTSESLLFPLGLSAFLVGAAPLLLACGGETAGVPKGSGHSIPLDAGAGAQDAAPDGSPSTSCPTRFTTMVPSVTAIPHGAPLRTSMVAVGGAPYWAVPYAFNGPDNGIWTFTGGAQRQVSTLDAVQVFPRDATSLLAMTTDGGLYAVPVEGSAPTQLGAIPLGPGLGVLSCAQGPSDIFASTTLSGDITSTTEAGDIWRIPMAGGAASKVLPGTATANLALDQFAADDRSLYFIHVNSGPQPEPCTVWTTSVDGGAPSPGATPVFFAYSGVLAARDGVAWVDEVPLDGGPGAPVRVSANGEATTPPILGDINVATYSGDSVFVVGAYYDAQGFVVDNVWEIDPTTRDAHVVACAPEMPDVPSRIWGLAVDAQSIYAFISDGRSWTLARALRP